MIEKRTYGRPAIVELTVYEKCKYDYVYAVLTQDEFNAVDVEARHATLIIDSWDIVDGEDAAELEAEFDGSCIDEYHEYLVLHLASGGTSTYRNSHVDMFRMGWG